MATQELQKPRDYFRIAWQSALAAGLCLGFPAGLLLWFILLRQMNHSAVIEGLIGILQSHGLYSIYILVISSVLWSYLLGRISGYRAWWRIAVAWRRGFPLWRTWTGSFTSIVLTFPSISIMPLPWLVWSAA
jgi:hypothetical protein